MISCRILKNLNCTQLLGEDSRRGHSDRRPAGDLRSWLLLQPTWEQQHRWSWRRRCDRHCGYVAFQNPLWAGSLTWILASNMVALALLLLHDSFNFQIKIIIDSVSFVPSSVTKCTMHILPSRVRIIRGSRISPNPHDQNKLNHTSFYGERESLKRWSC